MRIWIGDVQHGAQIAHAAGTGFDPEVDRCLSRVTVDGKLMGGFIFTNYTKVAIQVHCAGFVKRWCTPELLTLSFHYPFEQLKVERMFATVPSSNGEHWRMYKRAGWRQVARIPDAVPGGDMIVLSMSRKDCKWLRFAGRYIRRDAGQRELAA